ncbi:hypothetical protein [Acetivibrio ethanolgignens]|uniref:Uncharacterized protein n=1 Tax=Acetivibrio ethanolgignens TaxID=290052 RepID=A0A0V8QE56_9FIRM|nr:hypothetical protein [Acetivibrio ethanolgignens]KSV58518.1 hypothetical protein ASU35_12435 [Acetivibrio ethanolgignens]
MSVTLCFEALTVESNSNNDNNNIVEKTISKMGKEFIDKCFWTNSNTVKKLVDRVTPTSTTYNKKDSDSGWYEEWTLN